MRGSGCFWGTDFCDSEIRAMSPADFNCHIVPNKIIRHTTGRKKGVCVHAEYREKNNQNHIWSAREVIMGKKQDMILCSLYMASPETNRMRYEMCRQKSW